MTAFAELAAAPDATIDLLALAMAAEFREVDDATAMATLDTLGADLSAAAQRTTGSPEGVTAACTEVLGGVHGFEGDREHYDDPQNSMLDVVLERRRGLPILLSVVYIEAARRAGIALAGVGLPGHFVVGHFGADPPLLLDPFGGGATIDSQLPVGSVQPWTAHEIAMRMLNNLVSSYQRRGDLTGAIRAAQLRLLLPAPEALRDRVATELRTLQARLN
ncbi:MAG TPA: transglutaminase-like domain-containing protein [Solirubrobacteraceae bacterium]|nr:transglutaminase-like domain-containing protein [Solirubrobacteraceae bacterium]